MKLSTMVLLGAGGRALSEAHARESARVRERDPAALRQHARHDAGRGHAALGRGRAREVDDLDPVELARELRTFVGDLELEGSVFRSNHASNHLALAGSLPKDKPRLLESLDAVIAMPQAAPFVPDWLRGL